MDNQHKMIAGYRDLSAEEIARVNDIKALADKVGALFEALDYCAGTDKRCVAIAREYAQTAFMWTVRAVTKPTTF